MATENGRDLLWKPTNVKESTVKFWRDSGDSCLVNWVQGLVSVFPLVDMENPLSLNPLLCEAFSPSWLRFSLFSLTSINTLVTFQVFPTLRSGLTASRLLIQHHACFFFCFLSLQPGRSARRRENEDPLSGVSSWDARPTFTSCFSKASRS